MGKKIKLMGLMGFMLVGVLVLAQQRSNRGKNPPVVEATEAGNYANIRYVFDDYFYILPWETPVNREKTKSGRWRYPRVVGKRETYYFYANDEIDFNFEVAGSVFYQLLSLSAYQAKLIEKLESRDSDFMLLNQGMDFIEYTIGDHTYYHGFIIFEGEGKNGEGVISHEFIGFSKHANYDKFRGLYNVTFEVNSEALQKVIDEHSPQQVNG